MPTGTPSPGCSYRAFKAVLGTGSFEKLVCLSAQDAAVIQNALHERAMLQANLCVKSQLPGSKRRGDSALYCGICYNG